MVILDVLPHRLFNFLKAFMKGAGILHQGRPRTFNDFICLRKVSDNKHLVPFVDKAEVKRVVQSRGFGELVIPTLFVCDSVDDILWETLPERFVIKCTHDSGSAVVVDNKSEIDIEKLSRYFEKRLTRSHASRGREMVYGLIKPRIIIEEKIGEKASLVDYKFWCFRGRVELIQLDYNRHTRHRRNFYSRSWSPLDLEIGYPREAHRIDPEPQNLNRMLEIAESLSKDFKHVRVDLYNIDGRLFFGEMTFFHGAGFEYVRPAEWGIRLGNLMR